MTKSEARAISECTSRALRRLERDIFLGTEVINVPQKVRDEIWQTLKPAVDEIERVHEMALAELDNGR